MKKKQKNNPFKVFNAFNFEDDIIKNNIRKSNSIVYGMQSVRKQTGLHSRATKDWDVFSNKPKRLVKKTERALDRKAGNPNLYYSKEAQHKGTFKLFSVGRDGIQGTKDDRGLMDATITPRPMPNYNVIDGMRYRTLKQEREAKARAIKDPAYAFRKEKDSFDLADIKNYELKKKNRLLRNFLMK